MNTQKLKMNIGKILGEYICTVEKLYGTPLKVFLNFVMVTGFYFISAVATVASASIAYNIYHTPTSQVLFIFSSVIFPIESWVIVFQYLSISLGFMFWFGRVTHNGKNKKVRQNEQIQP
jgi:nitric oxide reductase large subunit